MWFSNKYGHDVMWHDISRLSWWHCPEPRSKTSSQLLTIQDHTKSIQLFKLICKQNEVLDADALHWNSQSFLSIATKRGVEAIDEAVMAMLCNRRNVDAIQFNSILWVSAAPQTPLSSDIWAKHGGRLWPPMAKLWWNGLAQKVEPLSKVKPWFNFWFHSFWHSDSIS